MNFSASLSIYNFISLRQLSYLSLISKISYIRMCIMILESHVYYNLSFVSYYILSVKNIIF